MSIAILIPYRGTKKDKSRLRKDFEGSSVEDLLYDMMQHVINEVAHLEEVQTIYVLTKKDEIDFEGNYRILKDMGRNLNDSVQQAFKLIEEENIIITMADLPLLKTRDVQKVIETIKKGKNAVLAPTSDNGTSILGFSKYVSFPLVFGINSALKFEKILQEQNIEHEILPHVIGYRDIDTFKDLIELENNSSVPDWLVNFIKKVK